MNIGKQALIATLYAPSCRDVPRQLVQRTSKRKNVFLVSQPVVLWVKGDYGSWDALAPSVRTTITARRRERVTGGDTRKQVSNRPGQQVVGFLFSAPRCHM
jgi:hypothetical protein